MTFPFPFEQHLDPDLCVLTTYFNPEDYVCRRENYFHFIEAMDACGVPCLTVECAFGAQSFKLPTSATMIRKRATSILWQKERLLNAAIRELPRSIRKIAWVDADILFENPAWPQEAARELDDHGVIQLFETAVCLPRGRASFRGEGKCYDGFGALNRRSPGLEREGWDQHGHTGFAWAARRELLDGCGLFDLSLTGGGDHLMAHAFVGGIDSRCVERMIGIDTPLHREFVRWGEVACRESHCRVGFVPGRIFHLWHGERSDRKYTERAQVFKQLGFDPGRDVLQASNGCWAWTGANPALQTWAEQYFASRKEDGDEPIVAI
jgi:hypothetical protein